MNILFISYAFHPQVGGIESSALLLLRELRKAGHEVNVITHVALGKATELDWPPVFRQPNFRQQWKLARWADVIYHHNPAFSYWLPSLTRRPTVFSIHTWVSRTDRRVSWKDRMKLGVLAKFPCIANSRATAAHLAGPSTVIEYAYDNLIFKSETPWEERHGCAFAGRLVSDKGVPTAIAAIREAKRQGHSIPLQIIGSGPDEAELRAQVSALGLEDWVTFAGRLAPEALAATLNQVKYLLVPSKWEEPFGIVALEGIACGCIPLGTNQGGLVDAIGPCGPLFEKDDAIGLADCLIRLEKEPDWVAQYRMAASEHLAAHSPKGFAAQYFEVFKQAVKK